MKKYLLILLTLFFSYSFVSAQNFGIVRKNYFSSYYDSTLMINIDVLDSSTIRLGNVNPTTGVVSNVGNAEYKMGINLTGATIDPYLNRYYICSGFNFLTFDLSSGNIINNVQIAGSNPTPAFQNFRFNNSDSTIYGMIPLNFYSNYFDSSSMSYIEVLDSTQIRFASINPITGRYNIIGNTSFSNLYTLAGNSIDPHQMLYYYSAVDTLIGIDIYTGAKYSATPILLSGSAIFENIAYSCADKSIYGLTRQNYFSTVFDSLLMDYVEIIDSTTFRLTKINPTTGVVTFISPGNIGAGGNLSGGAFVDPNSMTYYFSNGNEIAGVSLTTGLITSSVPKSFESDAFALDMMRSTQNCFDATALRLNTKPEVGGADTLNVDCILYPNPAQNEITCKINAVLAKIEIYDTNGRLVLSDRQKKINIARLSSGIYFVNIFTENGVVYNRKFIKY